MVRALQGYQKSNGQVLILLSISVLSVLAWREISSKLLGLKINVLFSSCAALERFWAN
jgi:hypothetical protein